MRSHTMIRADLHQDAQGKDYLLVHYSYYTSGKGTSYRYHVLQSINPNTGEKIGEYTHKYRSSRGSFSMIYQNKKNLYFTGKKRKPYCISLPNLEEVADPEKIKQDILAKNPKIKDIFELKVMEGLFKVNTSEAYTYWISLENLKIVGETKALKIRNQHTDKHLKYTPLGKIWKDFEKYKEREAWISLASGQKPKEYKSIITIDTIKKTTNIASKFAVNYAIVTPANYRSFVLEGDLRRHFLEILAEGKVQKLKDNNTYIKGVMLRPYREKGRIPTKRWAILTQKPYAAFVFHQSEMDEKKANFFLSKVSLENGKDLWKINLSELCQIKAEHYPEYNWLYDNTVICLFRGIKRNKILCFDTKNGSLKWEVEI